NQYVPPSRETSSETLSFATFVNAFQNGFSLHNSNGVVWEGVYYSKSIELRTAIDKATVRDRETEIVNPPIFVRGKIGTNGTDSDSDEEEEGVGAGTGDAHPGKENQYKKPIGVICVPAPFRADFRIDLETLDDATEDESVSYDLSMASPRTGESPDEWNRASDAGLVVMNELEANSRILEEMRLREAQEKTRKIHDCRYLEMDGVLRHRAQAEVEAEEKLAVEAAHLAEIDAHNDERIRAELDRRLGVMRGGLDEHKFLSQLEQEVRHLREAEDKEAVRKAAEAAQKTAELQKAEEERKAREAEEKRLKGVEAEARKKKLAAEAMRKKREEESGKALCARDEWFKVSVSALEQEKELATVLSTLRSGNQFWQMSLLAKTDPETKKKMRPVDRQLSVPMHMQQISATREQVNRKTIDLTNLLRGAAPEVRHYCMLKIAEQCANLCESLGAAADDTSCFPVAETMTGVVTQLGADGQLLLQTILATLNEKADMTVPKYRTYQANKYESQKAWQLQLGYQEAEGGGLEESSKFYDRVTGHLKLYAALLQCGEGSQAGLLEYAWKWLSRFLNCIPPNGVAAYALWGFLQIAGHRMFLAYRSQFVKLMAVIFKEFLPALRCTAVNDVTSSATPSTRKPPIEFSAGWQ
ncbi:hypothetical protein CYMTET_39957, partial [Cymbomonas tetramitiformis]